MSFYGYSRISTSKQSITRQNRNILSAFPTAIIKQETYTGTTNDRPVWNKLVKDVKPGDTIVFDSVSRMSRNATEGFKQYMDLFNKGVNLIFLKEPHINTDTYKKAFNVDMSVTTDNKLIELALDFIKDALELLAQDQIEKAFEQAQKEVDDLSQRTKEGLITAKANGKILGRQVGSKIETKKAKDNKAKIIKLSKTFDGTLSDKEVLDLLSIDRTTYYRYKKQIKAQMEE